MMIIVIILLFLYKTPTTSPPFFIKVSFHTPHHPPPLNHPNHQVSFRVGEVEPLWCTLALYWLDYRIEKQHQVLYLRRHLIEVLHPPFPPFFQPPSHPPNTHTHTSPPPTHTPPPLHQMNVNLVNSGRISEVFAFEATSVAVQDRFAPALAAITGACVRYDGP